MTVVESIKRKFNEYGRVLRVTKKPSKQEFISIMKVSGLGILAIGLIGFIIQMLRYFLLK